MSSFNEAERERIHTVISTVLENKALLLTPAPQASSFPRVLVAVMEAAAQYTDMTGLQKQALAKNAMNKIVKHHAPGLAPYLPLVDALCNEIVQAARQGLCSAGRRRASRAAAAYEHGMNQFKMRMSTCRGPSKQT